MKKHLLFISAALLSCSMVLNAQQVSSQRTCGTQPPCQEFETWLAQKIAERNADPNQDPQAVYNIPCIVHVIHSGQSIGSGTNISQNQVNSQYDVLNEDFRKLNADFSTVCPSVFQSVAADCQINFCKALRDPNGNTLTEPGIDRVNAVTKGWTTGSYTQSYVDATIKPQSIWNPANYLNIWVCNLGNGLLGYATFPAGSSLSCLSSPFGSSTTDGVVILYTAFGRVGNVGFPYDKGRSATHEIGHWLGLRHIWGDTNCGSDCVSDTPTQQTANFGCPPFPQVTCNNGPNGDMWCNYMDYTDDRCMVMFTTGQKSRIQTCMSVGTYRHPLASSFVCSPLGLADIDNVNKFNLYPNPTTGKITVDPLDLGNNLTIRIYDVVGNIVKELKLDNNVKTEIDLSAQGNGIYFIEIGNEVGKVTQKFTINK
jgi:hypothetical protein